MAVLLLVLSGCEQPQAQSAAGHRQHRLTGAWLARDGTVFHFRGDGTFHGMDFREREIWGNWVTLSESRIGFQSLLHDSFYNPQYAILDDGDEDVMNYIVTGGTHFITAVRIDPKRAEMMVEKTVAEKIHKP